MSCPLVCIIQFGVFEVFVRKLIDFFQDCILYVCENRFMAIPIEVFEVRHGESEQNLANARMKDGDESWYTPAYVDRHDTRVRLTARGADQAEQAGEWFERNGGRDLDYGLVSVYMRARETAARMNLNVEWELESLLGEQGWGIYSNLTNTERKTFFEMDVMSKKQDGFYWQPPRGESLLEVLEREAHVWDRVMKSGAQRAVLVSHNRFILCSRIAREGLDPLRFSEIKRDPLYKVENCSVVQYSRRDPVDGELSESFDWVRSVCPWDEERSDPRWRWIERPKFTNEQLLAQVEEYPRLFEEEIGMRNSVEFGYEQNRLEGGIGA